MNETTQRVILENQHVIMEALIILIANVPYTTSQTHEVRMQILGKLSRRIGATEAQFDYIKRP